MSDTYDFESCARAFASAGVAHSPSEVQGVICGLLATGHGRRDDELLGVLAAHVELPSGFDNDVSALLLGCRDQALAAFADTGLDLTLLLPEDEEDLGLRVAALGQWSEGFLVGFGTGAAGTSDSALSMGIQEALSDLAAISQVATPEDDDPEGEDMFEQVAEHCRMAALMIYTELVMKAERKGQPELKPGTSPRQH